MHKSTDSRRVIALIAAYVVALQALLLPLSVAAGAYFDSNLCATASKAHVSAPLASHDTGCGCAAACGMQCCGQTLANAPQIVIVLALTAARAITQPPAIEPNLRPPERGPQVPRAPPAA